MAVARKTERRLLLMDQAKARRLADALNRRMGVVIDPTATAEKAQERMLAHGIRPEDNEFSREIIRLRNQKYQGQPNVEEE